MDTTYNVDGIPSKNWDDVNSNYTLTQLGAYHMIGNDNFEPVKNNNFELRILFNKELYSVDAGRVFSKELIQNGLILSTVSVGGLTEQTEIVRVPYGNTEVKFSGKTTVNDSTVNYNDFIGIETERIIAAWRALVMNPIDQKGGRASVYKQKAFLIETAADGSHGRAWELKGIWPSSCNFGEYSYDGGASVRRIQLTLTFDQMIPRDN